MDYHLRKENARDVIADSRKKRSIGTWLIEYNVYGIVTPIKCPRCPSFGYEQNLSTDE